MHVDLGILPSFLSLYILEEERRKCEEPDSFSLSGLFYLHIFCSIQQCKPNYFVWFLSCLLRMQKASLFTTERTQYTYNQGTMNAEPANSVSTINYLCNNIRVRMRCGCGVPFCYCYKTLQCSVFSSVIDFWMSTF